MAEHPGPERRFGDHVDQRHLPPASLYGFLEAAQVPRLGLRVQRREFDRAALAVGDPQPVQFGERVVQRGELGAHFLPVVMPGTLAHGGAEHCRGRRDLALGQRPAVGDERGRRRAGARHPLSLHGATLLHPVRRRQQQRECRTGRRNGSFIRVWCAAGLCLGPEVARDELDRVAGGIADVQLLSSVNRGAVLLDLNPSVRWRRPA